MVLQNGSYTNQNKALPQSMQQDITNASSGQLYPATVGVDLPFGYPMVARNGSCSLIKNKYSSAIDSCAMDGLLYCCVNTTDWEVQKLLPNSSSLDI